MPVDALQWTEFADFSGGLWERTSDRECPQNGLLEAVDCYPQPRGGLKAFARVEPVSQAGLAANSIILACSWDRPPFPQGRLRLAALEIDAGGSGIHTLRIYGLAVNTLDSIKNGTWNEDATQPNVTIIDPSIQFTAYRDSAVGYRVWYNLPVAITTAASAQTTNYTAQGLYRLGSSLTTSTASSGTTQRVSAKHQNGIGSDTVAFWPGCVVSHQARLMWTLTFDQLHNRIGMTTQGHEGHGNTTDKSTDFVDPLGEKSGSVTWLQPSQSDYMVAAKTQVGAIVLQGAFPNPTNRQISFQKNYMQSFPCATDTGVFYMVKDDACYIAGQGGAQSITPNFHGTPMNPGLYRNASGATDFFSVANSDNIKLGQPTVAGDFLFAGNGYVFDTRTSAWFRSSYIPRSMNHTTDAAFFRMFCSSNEMYTGSNQVLHHAYFLENTDATVETWNPAPSYSFTLPLISNHHQDTEVREVVFHLDAFKPDSSITLEAFTPKGKVFSKKYEIAKAGPQKVRCDLNAKGDWVKLRAVVASDPKQPAPNEAPYIERVMVGTAPDTRQSQARKRGQ
jgi:hypothetical protein